MRQIAFTLLLLSTLAMQAQHIEQGSYWYNGAITYTATLQQGGNVVMSVTDGATSSERNTGNLSFTSKPMRQTRLHISSGGVRHFIFSHELYE